MSVFAAAGERVGGLFGALGDESYSSLSGAYLEEGFEFSVGVRKKQGIWGFGGHPPD
jgi:hypothetical protein